MRWHPDKCKDTPRDEATSHFQEINLAFQTISKWKETGIDERCGARARARSEMWSEPWRCARAESYRRSGDPG